MYKSNSKGEYEIGWLTMKERIKKIYVTWGYFLLFISIVLILLIIIDDRIDKLEEKILINEKKINELETEKSPEILIETMFYSNIFIQRIPFKCSIKKEDWGLDKWECNNPLIYPNKSLINTDDKLKII